MAVANSHDSNNTKIVNHTEEINVYPKVEESLRKITVEEGFKNYKMVITRLSTHGGNYLGELYEVNITGETKDGEKEINIFVKQLIPGLEDLVNVNAIYTNEVFMYNELGKIFITLQNEAEVPKNERYRMAESFSESSTDAIILENLIKKGYKTLDRMDVMPLNFAEESIKQLAKFHAMSFVLQYKRTDYFEKIIKPMRSPLHFDKRWIDFLKNITDILLEYFEGSVLNHFKGFCYKLYDKLSKYYKEESSSFKLLCHGDYRINNILINDNDIEEMKIVAVDYQFIYYGSPVFDFLYLIYTGTDRKFRENYMDHLKDLYHNTLTNFLKYFELDANTIYPREIFDKDFEDNIEVGLMMPLYLTPFCFSTQSEVPDFTKVDASSSSVKFKFDERCKVRITEIVEDYIKLGII